MPQHSTKLIINPNADMGNAWRQAADLRPIIEEFGGRGLDWHGVPDPCNRARPAGC